MKSTAFNRVVRAISVFGVMFFSSVSQASVLLGADRVIIQPGENSGSISIDGDKNRTYLVQSWVSTLKDEEATMFTTMPQLGVIEPKRSQSLRILYQGAGLPDDRESRFRLNIQSVAGQDEAGGSKNTLAPSFIQTISLFYRPKSLENVDSSQVPLKLKWTIESRTDNKYLLTVQNPSPIHLNFVNAFIVDRGQKSSAVFGYAKQIGYLEPFAQKTIEVSKNQVGKLQESTAERQLWFVVKNDAGFSVAYFATLNKDDVGSFKMFVPAAKAKGNAKPASNLGDTSALPTNESEMK